MVCVCVKIEVERGPMVAISGPVSGARGCRSVAQPSARMRHESVLGERREGLQGGWMDVLALAAARDSTTAAYFSHDQV